LRDAWRVTCRMLALVAAFTLLTGFSGQGHFKPIEAGASSELLTQVRELVKPVYALRGALFQLRLELIAADPANEQDRPLLQPWLDMPAAEAGFAALVYDKARGGDAKAREKSASSLAKSLGSLKERKDISETFVAMLDFEGMEIGKALALPEGGVASLAGSESARKRIGARMEEVKSILEQFKSLPSDINKVGAAAEKAVKETSQHAKKASKGDASAILATGFDVVGAVAVGQEVLDDINAVPKLLKAIASDSKAIGETFAAISGKLGDGFSGINFNVFSGFDGGLPTDAAYNALKALVPKK
jgi:hypothetical protein